ncbi:MAG: hypothetical protein CEE38_18550 [Planctomycetes bacterium B3_Pla]|nr:MAG: hypothetical protein CEE38_18550 [Planctomycetes bacterium B3_Pla]
MEDSKKKPIMIGIIVVSLGVAGLVTFKKGSGSGGIKDIPEGDATWVKCNNPECKAEYEMGTRDYYKALTANMNPNPTASGPTPLPCKKCNKPSLFGAEKCQNPDCGTVFIQGIAGQNDHPDRCPECGQSATEESRKKRLAEG